MAELEAGNGYMGMGAQGADARSAETELQG